MKRQLSIFLLLLAFVFSISAQEKETRKVDELSSFWQCEEARAVIDNFFIKLQNNPQSTGFIIYYEGKYSNGKEKSTMLLPRRGEADFRVQIIRDHLKLRRYDSSRVLFINGGFREEQTTEFWLMPNGADLPKPTPTLNNIKYRKGKLPDVRCFN